MPLKVDETKLYDAEYRNRILERVTEALESDDRITGALLVGSGAKGFRDRYSDVDITILVDDEAQVDEAYEDWWRRLHASLPILGAFKDPTRHLFGLLLDRYMELDVSFQGEIDLYAHEDNWKILFDKSGVIPGLMKPREKISDDPVIAHAKRTRDSWYYVVHAITAIQRGQPLRADYFIGYLRNEATVMAGQNRGLNTSIRSYFADADKLLIEVKKRITDSIPLNQQPIEQHKALRAITDLYYDEATRLDEKLGLNNASSLRKTISEYLSAFS